MSKKKKKTGTSSTDKLAAAFGDTATLVASNRTPHFAVDKSVKDWLTKCVNEDIRWENDVSVAWVAGWHGHLMPAVVRRHAINDGWGTDWEDVTPGWSMWTGGNLWFVAVEYPDPKRAPAMHLLAEREAEMILAGIKAGAIEAELA